MQINDYYQTKIDTLNHIILHELFVLVKNTWYHMQIFICSIPDRVIPKTFKMVLDTSLLNTQQYKVRIEGKVEQSRERSSALPYTSG